MSGYEIETPAAGATDYTSFNTQVTYQRSGFQRLSLNPIIDGTTPPRVAAGSKVEINGGLFYFASTEAVTGTASTSNVNYIMLVTSSSAITAEFTTEVPTWNDSKNGFYDATGGKRMVGRVDYDSTTYTDIGILPERYSLWDKDGREVIATQIETKNLSTTVVGQTAVDRDVIGFSFTPTAVLDATVQGWDSGSSEYIAWRNGLFGVNQDAAIANPKPAYATVGTNKVTVRVVTVGSTATTYYAKITVTAARAI